MSERTTIDVSGVRFSTTDDGAVEGVAVAWDRIDSYGTSFDRRAFADVRGPLPALWSHDPSNVVGSWQSVTIGDDGLRVVGRLNLDVAKAREVRALLANGDVSGLSIGFTTESAETKPGGVRHVTKAHLHEISFVAMPSVPGSRVTSVRSTETEESTMDKETTTEAPNRADLSAVNEALAEMRARLDDVEVRAARPATRVETTDENADERRAFTRMLRHGREAMPSEEVRSLRVADDTAGGYLAPAQFVAEVIKGIVERSPVRQAARVGNTASGEVILPKRTGHPTGYWVGETETRTETQSTYGQLEIPIHEMACYVDVSQRLLEDAAVNIEAEVAFDLAEEFGRLESSALMMGDGVKKPRGIMENADVPYSPTGNASTLGSDPAGLLIDVFYSVSPTYRARGVWMMAPTTVAAVRKLKDAGSGAFLWQPALSESAPATLLGRPIIEDPTMDAVGSAAEPILFGDVGSAYRVFDRMALSIMRDPYSVATSGLVRFHARRRVGGGMVLAEALRKVRCATS